MGFSLEGVQAERDSPVKERDILRASMDEMLQTHDRLLDQLTEGQSQVQVMEPILEGTRTPNGLEGLVQSSDTGCDLLFRHLSQALERTIQVVQAKLEEAGLEVPSSLWDVVWGDVSSPDPF
ncbi:hypothetical protein LIER_43366 [Lithospermum erythrorhizon]|uniref:Uncharacterized protein n=1 Tax=Lithospermum erythrorhizon TaxID=34254 RepID=A0AAV3PXJ2_LITER